MAAPAFTIAWIIEKLINDAHVGVGALVAHKVINLLRRRRQSRQVVVNAAQECFFISLRRGNHAFLLEFREDEFVYRVGSP